MTLHDLVSDLRPRERHTVMELVEQAGIDVSGWSRKKDGSPCLVPAANPNYCYEWCFGGGTEPALLSIWHDDLRVVDDHIVYESRSAYRYDSGANTANRLRRAKRFDDTIGEAFGAMLPIRVILLAGVSNPPNRQRVEFRKLDEPSWRVTEFDTASGRFVLQREPVSQDH